MKPQRGQIAFLVGAVAVGFWAGTLLVPLAALAFMAVGGGASASWLAERIPNRR